MIFKNSLPTKLILLPRTGRDITSFAIGFDSGALWEPKRLWGATGIFVRSSFFHPKGTDKRAFFKNLERSGLFPSFLIGLEFSNVLFQSRYSDFELYIRNIIELFKKPNPNRKRFQVERERTLARLKSRYENPLSFALEKIIELSLPKPLNRSPLGDLSSVSSLSYEDALKAWDKVLCCPKVAVLCGRVAPAHIELFKELLSVFKRKNDTRALNLSDDLKPDDRVFKRNGVSQSVILMSVKVPKPSERDFGALNVLSTMLGDGMSGAMFKHLREKLALAYSTGTILLTGRSFSRLLFYIESAKAKEAALEMENFFKNLPSFLDKRGFEIAKTKLKASRRKKRDFRLSFASETVGSYMLRARREFMSDEYLDKLEFEDVLKLAEKVSVSDFVRVRVEGSSN